MRRNAFLAALVLGFGASPLFGYVLEGQSWTKDRTVVMQLSLGTGTVALSDGFTSFNQSAEDALNVWNQYLAHLKFAVVRNSPVTPAENDDEMSVFFSDTVFGDRFGSGVLATTILSYRGTTMEETDTVMNSARTWDSYRGPLRPGVDDFHRVVMHEFGHTLGLDHPDQAHPRQNVVALMNSDETDIDTVQADDIAGVQALYSTGPAYRTASPAPNLVNLSTRGLVSSGENVLIGGFIIQGSQPVTVVLRAIGFSLASHGLQDALADPTLELHDSTGAIIASNDDWFTSADAETIASYRLDPSNSIESAMIATLNPGNYTAIVRGYSNSTGVGLIELFDLHQSNSRAGNISTRGEVLTGDDVMIGGFIIGDSQTKSVVIRALGPSLTSHGVTGALADPMLELHDGQGNLMASNDDWGQGPNATMIQNEGLAPSSPKESALQATLPPGNYTAIVRGVNNANGIALVEVYDLSPAPN
jgi:hypothetical protein